MLSDRCYVCPVLSLTLVYCGETVGIGWIKMPLGVEVGVELPSTQATLCYMGTQLPRKGAQPSPIF